MAGGSTVVTLGVDLGGTKVETALVDAAGHIVASHRYLMYLERGPTGVISDVVSSAKSSGWCVTRIHFSRENTTIARLGNELI